MYHKLGVAEQRSLLVRSLGNANTIIRERARFEIAIGTYKI